MFELFHRVNYWIRVGMARLHEALQHFGGILVSPIERVIGATFGRAMQASEGFERVDHWLLGLLWLFTWPVRIVWRLVAAIAAAVLPAFVLNALSGLTSTWFRLMQGLGATVLQLAEWLNLDSLMRWIAWLTQPLWRPLAAVGGFFIAWCATRPYKQMLWGAPVLLFLVPIAGAAAWNATLGQGAVATHYSVAIKDAREREDFELVQLLERKLDQLGVDTERSDFEVALALAKKGKLEEAYQGMQEIAPEDAPGFVAAHHWIVLRTLGNELPIANEERLRVAGVHLAHLKKLGLKGDDFTFLQAVWLAQSGRLEEAADMLGPLTTKFQPAALQRFEIDLRLKRLDEARQDARALCTHFETAKRRGAEFTSEQYLAWAQAERVLGESTEWARIVREWFASDPNHPGAKQSVAALDLQEFNDMLRSQQPDAGELVERLVELTKLADKPEALDTQLAQLYRSRQRTAGVAKMFDLLIASSETPIQLIAAIGTAAAIEGDVARARTLLERVVAVDAKNAVAWNNLAWARSQDPDKDLAKALDAVSRALELMPDEFRFRETRGQIMVSLGRWKEAVDDLEYALNGMPDAAPVHVALATAYEGLGQDQLAKIHRQHAQ